MPLTRLAASRSASPTSRAVRLRRAVAAASGLALAATGAVVVAAPAQAASATVVINEVYGGGGNSGATWTNDFIELRNLGSLAVDVTGWSVQYASAAGSSYQTTALSGSIPAYGYYLVQEAPGAGGTSALPTADASGSIAMSGTNGKVALVSASTALSCGADCDTAAGVVDFVGYGTANDFEGAPAPALTNTTSVVRSGSTDTDSNAADFATGVPAPTNSLGETEPPTDPEEPEPTCSATPGATRIHDIQGAGWLTGLATGAAVTSVPGIVTQIKFGSSGGFYLQDPTPDADPATSEGIFVFTRATPTVAIGDSVTVCGTVSEFRPSGASSLSGTQITPITGGIVTVATGVALPAALAITPTTVPDLYAPDASGVGGNIESLTPIVPSRSALDFWESHEGELVTLTDPRLVGPSNEFDESYVTTKPDQQPTVRGGTYADSYALPSGRLELLSRDTAAPWPAANVGDVYAGAVTGTIEWNGFGGYLLLVDPASLSVTDNGLAPTVAQPQGDDELAVGTYNVENLSPLDSPAKFARLAEGVVDFLAAPDVVALEEIQDNTGPTNDGVVAADQTMATFIAAIVAAGGPTYDYRSIDPVDGADGGAPGGNIRVVLMFNPERVSFVDTPGGTATSDTTITVGDDGVAHLSASPGRIAPTDGAWSSSRKPLAGEFLFQGQTVFVVANHFNSKGGDDNADGRFQPPSRSSEVQRVQQATLLHGFVASLLDSDDDASLVVAGDINDYPYSPALSTLTTGPAGDQPVLTDLITLLPANEQYTYVFNGISQVLDHILVTPALVELSDYEVIHANAEFADQASDHDPQVVRLNLAQEPVYDPQVSVTPGTVRAGAQVTLTITGFAPNAPLTLSLDGGAIVLGTATADETGAATVTVTVPRSTPAGPHTVTVQSGELVATAALAVDPPAPLITPAVVVRFILAILRSIFGFGR